MEHHVLWGPLPDRIAILIWGGQFQENGILVISQTAWGSMHVHVCVHTRVCVCTHPLCVSVTLQGAFLHLNSQLKPTLALNARRCFSALSCLPSRPLI